MLQLYGRIRSQNIFQKCLTSLVNFQPLKQNQTEAARSHAQLQAAAGILSVIANKPKISLMQPLHCAVSHRTFYPGAAYVTLNMATMVSVEGG